MKFIVLSKSAGELLPSFIKGGIAKFVERNATDQRDPGAGWQLGIRHQIPISSSEKQQDQTHHPALIDWQCLMMF